MVAFMINHNRGIAKLINFIISFLVSHLSDRLEMHGCFNGMVFKRSIPRGIRT